MICCQYLPENQRVKSPFRRMLVSAYYDGPTQGFTTCVECGLTYVFDLVAWDDMQDLRIFSFAACPETFSQIVRNTISNPQWNENVIILPPLDEPRDTYVGKLVGLVPSWIVASTNLDKELLIWRRLAPADLSTVQNWFEYLGLRV